MSTAFFVQCKAAHVNDVLEGAVVAIAIEIVRCAVVGDDEVGPAVVVDVGEDGSEAVAAFVIGDAGFEADVGEGAVAVVVKEMITFTKQPMGPQKNVDHTVLAGAVGDSALPCHDGTIEIVVEVARDEEFEQTVAVVIAPGCACGPAAQSDVGNVGERAPVIVVVEAILAVVRDVNVWPAIVVVIEKRDTGASMMVDFSGEPER